MKIALAMALGACTACVGGSDQPAVPRVGGRLPALTFASLGGDSLALDQLAGSPVLLNLWATWCPPCRAEIPFLQSLHDEYAPRGLRVIGISSDNAGALDQVEEFLAEAGVTYENLLDPRGLSLDAFRLLGLPATYLIDRRGVITLVRPGPVSETDRGFLDAIDDLVGPIDDSAGGDA